MKPKSYMSITEAIKFHEKYSEMLVSRPTFTNILKEHNIILNSKLGSKIIVDGEKLKNYLDNLYGPLEEE